MITLKLCKKCTPPQLKPLSDFYFQSGTPDYKSYRCKQCAHENNKRTYKLRKEREKK